MATMHRSLGVDKRAMREELLARRTAQPSWLHRLKSWQVARRVQRLSALRRARVIFAYFPVKREVDTRFLIRRLLERGQVVALPRVSAKRELVFHRIQDLSDLVLGAYGIPEPNATAGSAAALKRADVILVPGIAFSLTGRRLGYGGGYYDTLLKSRRAPALGLAFESQLLADLPQGPRDMRLDALATERRLLLFGQSSGHSFRSSTSVPPMKI